MGTSGDTVRIAALADIHYSSKTSQGAWQPVLAEISERADILVLGGDLTDFGLPEEGRALAKELSAAVKIPIVGVLGNHDFESGKQAELLNIFHDAGVMMLDGDSCEIHGIGFAGVKGFAGGFGRYALGPWGEASIKGFVHEAVEEALKLETALARLRIPRRVAVLHYSPIQATVEGEPLEIYPFLGCSRLEEPLRRYPVDVVFHGHAHHGRPEGRTDNGVPVYNVSTMLLRSIEGQRPYRLVEISIGPADRAESQPAAPTPFVERRRAHEDRRVTGG